jgi:hypothetical protein
MKYWEVKSSVVAVGKNNFWRCHKGLGGASHLGVFPGRGHARVGARQRVLEVRFIYLAEERIVLIGKAGENLNAPL